jgi:hypothetical protein
MEVKLANGLETLKRHLRLNVAHSAVSETEQLVLKFGNPYFGIKRPKSFRLGGPKQCFMNATLALCKDDTSLDDISYVEGFAMKTDLRHIFPFHHAWIVFGNDRAVDLTLRDNSLGVVYFGIPFSRTETIELLRSRDVYGFFQAPVRPEVIKLVKRKFLNREHDSDINAP